MLQCDWAISVLSFSLLILSPLHAHSFILNRPLPRTGFINLRSKKTTHVVVTSSTFTVHRTSTEDSSSPSDLERLFSSIFRSIGDLETSLASNTGGIGTVTTTPSVTSLDLAPATSVPLLASITTTTTAIITATSVLPLRITVASPNTAASVASTSTTTSQSQPTTISAPKTKIATGTVVGNALGGVALIALLLVAFFVYRRRQYSTEPTLVPLIHDQNYTQPLDKSGRLAQVIYEKAAAQRQRDQLRTDLEAINCADSDPRSTANASEGESEARLRHQVEMMSERILELEYQQRELEDHLEDRSQPPPGYSATAGGRSVV